MDKIETVCIVGAGFMGAQIGLHCAAHGHDVWLVDAADEALERSGQVHAQVLGTRLEKGQITVEQRETILGHIHFTTEMQEAASKADLAIEAVPERLELKREIFGQLDAICPSHTILATNSSSIRISAIEDATGRPDRVLNTHFYPPVWQRTMVELMRGTQTSDETIECMRRFAHGIGMTPLMVRKESTGFIFNRVWRTIRNECFHIVSRGVASFEDVDRMWIIATGMPVGPFGTMDMIGLDVVWDSEMVHCRESGDDSLRPSKLLADKIEQGELGVKTGKGFYTYPNPAFQDPSWLKGQDD